MIDARAVSVTVKAERVCVSVSVWVEAKTVETTTVVKACVSVMVSVAVALQTVEADMAPELNVDDVVEIKTVLKVVDVVEAPPAALMNMFKASGPPQDSVGSPGQGSEQYEASIGPEPEVIEFPQ